MHDHRDPIEDSALSKLLIKESRLTSHSTLLAILSDKPATRSLTVGLYEGNAFNVDGYTGACYRVNRNTKGRSQSDIPKLGSIEAQPLTRHIFP